ncbi:hypothetical protein HDU76_013686 [Blyttiomyces sp. JEL0837]|nr:hypothetical protein HDU76_013686 [Blyttiomyces sp. JEL0837]
MEGNYGPQPHKVQISLGKDAPALPQPKSDGAAKGWPISVRPKSGGTTRPRSTSPSQQTLEMQIPTRHQEYGHRSSPSPAVAKMKACNAQRERQEESYSRQFIATPHSAQSAKSQRRSSAGSLILGYKNRQENKKSPTHHGSLKSRPSTADGRVNRAAKTLASPGSTAADTPSSFRHAGYAEPTLLGSPLSAKMIATMKDEGADKTTAASLGAAVDTLGVTNSRRGVTPVPEPTEIRLIEAAKVVTRPTSARTRTSSASHSGRVTPAVVSLKQPAPDHPGGRSTHSAKHHRIDAFDEVAVSEETLNAEIASERARQIKRELALARSYEVPGTHTGRKPFNTSDYAMIDHYLCTLTDSQCSVEQTFEAVNAIMAMAEENTAAASTILYDRGTVTILLSLMSRMSDNYEILAKCCYIFQLLAKENPLTFTSLYKQQGIDIILSAVQTLYGRVVSEQGQENKNTLPVPADPRINLGVTDSVSRNSSIKRSKKASSGTGVGSRSNSKNNLSRAQSLGSASSLASLVTDEPRDSSTVNPSSQTASAKGAMASLGPGIAGTYRAANTDEMMDESLMGGLLQKYYEPRFLSQMDRMDKTTRSEIVKHLLTLFEKVDKLLAVSGLISLDINMDEAMDQIVTEAAGMLQCELILLYLVDPETGELIAVDYDPWMDAKERELIEDQRFPAGTGIAGKVAQTEIPVNIRDASNHEHFDPEIDVRDTDVNAYSVLCVPMKNKDGVLKGVIEAVNKIGPNGSLQFFNHEDEYLLKTLGKQAGIIINNAQIYAQMKKTQKKVEVLLETTRSLGSTLELDLLIKMIMDAAKELLSADRCTLFLIDSKGKQLRAHIQGRDLIQEIRIPINSGVAGFVYSTGSLVNIHDAYKDSRFNPEVDRQTGYVTRNMLCMPIKNISGESIGVTQMINRKHGAFDAEDEKILSSFSAQAAVAIEKSYLFKKTEDMLRETSQVKNYLSMILQSITNVVLTLDSQGRLSHINHPSKMDMESMLDQMKLQHYEVWLGESNATFIADIQRAFNTPRGTIIAQDYELTLAGKVRNVNYTIVQMTAEVERDSRDANTGGVVIVLEDISSEKRALMTLGRYMSPALAKQVMAEDGGQLGGKRKKVAILFSDIRSFTTLSESMEPHEVVELLNHHFSDAVNAILAEQGILDKYIGDAVMAVFGVPFVNQDDSIHACNAALRMKESLAIFNETRGKAGMKQIKIGVGINTGMVG